MSLFTESEKVVARSICQGSFLGFRTRYLASLVFDEMCARVKAKKQLSVIPIFFFIWTADHLVVSGWHGTADTCHFCHIEHNLTLNYYFCTSDSVYILWKKKIAVLLARYHIQVSRQIKVLIFNISGVCFGKIHFLQWVAQDSDICCFFSWLFSIPLSLKPKRELASLFFL